MIENNDKHINTLNDNKTGSTNCEFLREMIHNCEKTRKEKSVNKVGQYTCKPCNYKTKRKNDYRKHVETNKHKWNVENIEVIPCVIDEPIYTCHNCHAKYSHRSNLYRHRRKCKKEGSKVKKDRILETLLKDNETLHEQIMEIKNKPQIVNNLYKNKYVNVVQFLNDDCKDAFNLSDFVNMIQVSTTDLQYMEENGYIQGIQNSFIRQLKTTEEKKRPIHCTDFKRKQFYIKENNIWDKDNENEQLLDALNTINMNQLKVLEDWKDNNEWFLNDTNHDKLNNIFVEITQMYGDDKDKITRKLIHEISNATSLGKLDNI